MAVPYILRISIALILCSTGVLMQDQYGALNCLININGDILTATINVLRNMSTFDDVFLTDDTEMDAYAGISECDMNVMTGSGDIIDPVMIERSVNVQTDQPTDGQACGLTVLESHVLYQWTVRTQHQYQYSKHQDKIFLFQCNVTDSLPVVISVNMTFEIHPTINLNPTSETLNLNVVDTNGDIITSIDIGKKIALRLKLKYDSIALDPPNLALGKPAFQSSDATVAAPASRAVDGDSNPSLVGGSCSHTDPNDNTNLQYWQVDLQDAYDISEVRLVNRADGLGSLLENIEVLVGVTTLSFVTCYEFQGPGSNGADYKFTCNEIVRGRYVRIRKTVPGLLTFCEVEVYGANLGPYGVYCERLFATPDANHVYGQHDLLLTNGCPSTQYLFLQPAWGFRKRQESSPVNSLFFTQTGVMKAAKFDKRNDFTVTNEVIFVCQAKFCWRPGDTNCDDFCATSTGTIGRRRRRELTEIEDDTTVQLTATLIITDPVSNVDQESGSTAELPEMYIYLLAGLGLFMVAVGAIFVCLCLRTRRRHHRDRNYKHYVDNTSASSAVSSKSGKMEPRLGSTC